MKDGLELVILDAGNLFTSVFTQTHPLCGANLTSLYLADTVGPGKTCQQLAPTNSSEFISLQSRNTGENSFLNALQKYFLSRQIQSFWKQGCILFISVHSSI